MARASNDALKKGFVCALLGGTLAEVNFRGHFGLFGELFKKVRKILRIFRRKFLKFSEIWKGKAINLYIDFGLTTHPGPDGRLL